MPINFDSNGNTCSIVIDGEMTISTAASLKDELMEIILHPDSEIAVDLSGVEAMDTAGLQILLLLNRETLLLNKTMSIKAVSDPVRTTLALYNIQEIPC